MTITEEYRVGDIATEVPLATRVFHRHNIDFCCGGGTTLRQACQDRGLDPGSVLQEIHQITETSTDATRRWDEAPPEDLIDHILEAYHVPLVEELSRIASLSRKVADRHGPRHAELRELATVFAALHDELMQHMAKEEQILFPMIRNGHGAMVGGPVSVMLHEHDEAAAALRRMRALSNDFTLPADACNSWRALWAALENLEVELHKHIHLENNVLFPAVLGEEAYRQL